MTGSGSDWRKNRAETIEQDDPDWGALFVAVAVELVAVVAGFLSAPAQPEATVMMTAVGMFGQGGGWGIPLGHLTLIVTLGGISEKPGAVDGRVEIREYLSVTLSFDHDIIDGAPAARFAQRFREPIEDGNGLAE